MYYKARGLESTICSDFAKVVLKSDKSNQMVCTKTLKSMLLFLFDYSKTTPNIILKGFNKHLDCKLFDEVGLSYQDIFVYQLNKANLWRLFNDTYTELQISYSSFIKYFPHNFKQAAKKTDMCDICMVGDKLISERVELNSEERAKFEKSEQFKAFNYHRIFTKYQSKAYKYHISNLNLGNAIIICDFKENFQVGGGPIENSQNYYNKLPISLLTFGIYFNIGNGIQFKLFNYFSYILSKDSQYVQQCMRYLFQQQVLLNQINSIEIWSDCAGHFRSKSMLSFYRNWNIHSINFKISFINFFPEKHGKSIIDGYFGLLSRWQIDYEKSNQIKNIQQLVDIFNQYHINNVNINTLYSNAYNFIVQTKIIMPFIHYDDIEDINTFLSYRFDQFDYKAIYKCAYRHIEYLKYTIAKYKPKYKENEEFFNPKYKTKYATDIIEDKFELEIGTNTIALLNRRFKYLQDNNLIDSNTLKDLINELN
ncbi:hypothetical protein CONCODRAFT_14165 [Conidiobolus coronatus NRRL 28638]|uniref:Uncharacterized protein n=1 Tax=Conidiobolus coronatus (strain ATCC 28846 / CBS 209.66 / NRRL 28638) TaxID=796925 RepID=A0A137NPI5_CONC2|nr:hypothetical protein CONCODRAFT_14165 [Conidiobolus coronatus NRRL 28638]|eukprot:KXN64648.1 hypothetical protein CONCODRAFT_14165 [Conidiobolus coronatus NRRL 28638]